MLTGSLVPPSSRVATPHRGLGDRAACAIDDLFVAARPELEPRLYELSGQTPFSTNRLPTKTLLADSQIPRVLWLHIS
jgi:hypothetical protein